MFAIGAHGIQRRKYTGEPYWFHLRNVVDILADCPVTFPQYCAAWLHDVVEDTPITIFHILENFGEEVARYVSALTEPDKSFGNRKARKEFYNNQLANAPACVQTIKYADMLDNLSSIKEYDRKFAKVYCEESRILLPMIEKGDRVLYKKICNLVQE